MPVPSPSDYTPFDADTPAVFASNDVYNYLYREYAFESF